MSSPRDLSRSRVFLKEFEMQTINVKQLAEKQRTGKIDLIDVRMPVEFREVHADGAQNYPLDSLNPKAIVEGRNGRSAEPLYLICKSGNRSSKAVQKFIDAGIENVVSVEGGTTAWDQAGLPVKRGKKAISLERQVRIAAGSIALIGSVATMVTGNVYLAGIPAFIGAGLTFAGITDTCGMGMMLAKMPWNRCKDGGSCSV
jgi:rhodanese-related sulfurtransferase